MRTEQVRLGQLNCLAAYPDRPDRPLPDDALISAAAAAPPVVLVHGLGGGNWGWEYFQQYFAQHGVTTYALELPGHGAQVDPHTARRMGTYSVESYALWVASALAELGRSVVIGHSMGGLIAQKLAESQCQEGFIFLASAPPWHMFRRAYKRMWSYILRHPWQEIVAPLTGRPMLMDSGMQAELVNNRLPPEIRADVSRQDVPDSGRACVQMAVGLVSIDVKRVASPCLVIGGLADRLIPPSEQRRLAEFYGCPLQMYDCGHMLMLEPGWEQVADGILGWITQLPAATTDLASQLAAD